MLWGWEGVGDDMMVGAALPAVAAVEEAVVADANDAEWETDGRCGMGRVCVA